MGRKRKVQQLARIAAAAAAAAAKAETQRGGNPGKMQCRTRLRRKMSRGMGAKNKGKKLNHFFGTCCCCCLKLGGAGARSRLAGEMLDVEQGTTPPSPRQTTSRIAVVVVVLVFGVWSCLGLLEQLK